MKVFPFPLDCGLLVKYGSMPFCYLYAFEYLLLFYPVLLFVLDQEYEFFLHQASYQRPCRLLLLFLCWFLHRTYLFYHKFCAILLWYQLLSYSNDRQAILTAYILPHCFLYSYQGNFPLLLLYQSFLLTL